jgi:hypothetical protein
VLVAAGLAVLAAPGGGAGKAFGSLSSARMGTRVVVFSSARKRTWTVFLPAARASTSWAGIDGGRRAPRRARERVAVDRDRLVGRRALHLDDHLRKARLEGGEVIASDGLSVVAPVLDRLRRRRLELGGRGRDAPLAFVAEGEVEQRPSAGIEPLALANFTPPPSPSPPRAACVLRRRATALAASACAGSAEAVRRERGTTRRERRPRGRSTVSDVNDREGR